MSGIFIAKGMTIQIPAGALQISREGPSASLSKINVNLDMCTPWLEAAMEHLKSARASNQKLKEIWENGSAEEKGHFLREEFKSSMQSITSSAFAIDAFYAAIGSKLIDTQKPHTADNSNKRTSRSARIAETFKIAFQQSDRGFQSSRDYLQQIYRFRDQAVHPSNDFEEAILHPQFNVGLERRFIAYRFEAALPSVYVTLEIIGQLTTKGRPRNGALKKYADYLSSMLRPFREDPIFSEIRLTPT